MLVGVDLCNTIANINYELLKKFKITLNRYPAPEVPDDYFISPEGLKVFIKAKPFKYAREVLNQMYREGYQLIYVTSRPKKAAFLTRRWLELNEFPKGRVEFVQNNKKANLAIDEGMEAFFDDDPAVVKELIDKNFRNILVKAAPYNAFLTNKNVFRFHEWSELKPFLENISKSFNR